MNDLSTLQCHNLALITINLNNSDFPPYYEANGSEEKRLEMLNKLHRYMKCAG